MSEYESPIEEYLLDKLRSHLAPGASLDLQVPFETFVQGFRVDALLKYGCESVAIECDGREFHDPYRDEWRDALLLGHRHVTSVVRFGGANIMDVPLVCLLSLSLWFPDAFTERGRIVFAGAGTQMYSLGGDESRVFGRYHVGGNTFREFKASRTGTGGREMWRTYWSFAYSCGKASLDEIIKKWRSSDRNAARIIYAK